MGGQQLIFVRMAGRLAAALLLGVALFSGSISLAADSDDPGEDENESEKPEEQKGPTEREKKILELFNATSKAFEKGQIVLNYNFESRKDDEVSDWSPLDTSLKSRIHWATSGELEFLREDEGGSYTSRSPKFADGGIVLADFGEWKHKAVFLPDLEVSVDLMNVAQPRAGTVVCPIFYSKKKKLSLGASNAAQIMTLNGWKTSKSHPKNEKTAVRRLRQEVGYKLNGRLFEGRLNGKKVADSSTLTKFTEGFDVGQAGIAWSGSSGSVKVFVFGVTIRGRLDPDWVSEQLGEKSQTAEKGKTPGTKDKAPGK